MDVQVTPRQCLLMPAHIELGITLHVRMFTCGIIDILSWIVLCCQGMCCTLQDSQKQSSQYSISQNLVSSQLFLQTYLDVP